MLLFLSPSSKNSSNDKWKQDSDDAFPSGSWVEPLNMLLPGPEMLYA